MTGKTPCKVARGNPSQKSWQNVWSYLKFKWERKDSCIVIKSRMVQHFARGYATKNPWKIAKPAKATWVACIVVEKPMNEVTKEPLVICEGQDPRISPSKLHLYNYIVPFHFIHNTYRKKILFFTYNINHQITLHKTLSSSTTLISFTLVNYYTYIFMLLFYFLILAYNFMLLYLIIIMHVIFWWSIFFKKLSEI